MYKRLDQRECTGYVGAGRSGVDATRHETLPEREFMERGWQPQVRLARDCSRYHRLRRPRQRVG